MSVAPKEGGLSAVTDIMVSAAAGLPAFAALVALAPEGVSHLAFERRLNDQPQRQADQIAPSLRPSPNLRSSRPRSSSRVRSGADSLGIAMLPGAPAPTDSPLPVAIQAGCIPAPVSSKLRPSPHVVAPQDRIRLIALKGRPKLAFRRKTLSTSRSGRRWMLVVSAKPPPRRRKSSRRRGRWPERRCQSRGQE